MSAFIKHVLLNYTRDLKRVRTEARELELLNCAADALVSEVEDVLRYQADVDECQKSTLRNPSNSQVS